MPVFGPAPLRFTLLRHTAFGDVLAAVHSVSDAVNVPDRLAAFQQRWQEAVVDHTAWTALYLVHDITGPAGWAGFIPYLEHPDVWESTTYLAPRLRGTGAFDAAKCLQAHDAARLPGPCITSIDTANVRSIRATSRYAAAHGWPPPTERWEHRRDRQALIFDWPTPAAHTCSAAIPPTGSEPHSMPIPVT